MSRRRAATLHRRAFAAEPEFSASAPGRVNLIGEHIDYNGGPVLPIPLPWRTTVAVSRATRFLVISELEPGPRRLDDTGYTAYVGGVVAALSEAGIKVPPSRVAIASDVPAGAGLASSAALTVATARALARLAGARLPREVLVDVAFRAEHDHVGVRCGRMDQVVAVHGRPGRAILYETATGSMRQVPVGASFGLWDTGVRHRLTGGLLDARRAECESALRRLQLRWPELKCLADVGPELLGEALHLLPTELGRRVRHVVSETARTRRAAALLEGRRWGELGALLLDGHRSLQRDYESSCAEADTLVRKAAKDGALGARLTGAGWGGVVLVLEGGTAEGRTRFAWKSPLQAAREGNRPGWRNG